MLYYMLFNTVFILNINILHIYLFCYSKQSVICFRTYRPFLLHARYVGLWLATRLNIQHHPRARWFSNKPELFLQGLYSKPEVVNSSPTYVHANSQKRSPIVSFGPKAHHSTAFTSEASNNPPRGFRQPACVQRAIRCPVLLNGL